MLYIVKFVMWYTVDGAWFYLNFVIVSICQAILTDKMEMVVYVAFP